MNCAKKGFDKNGFSSASDESWIEDSFGRAIIGHFWSQLCVFSGLYNFQNYLY